MAESVGPLSAARRALLQKLRSGEIELPRPAGLARRDPGQPVPLSFAQERVWVIDRLNPGSWTYNMPFAVRLRGALDEDALRRALQKVVARHAAWRTAFVLHDGHGPRQEILGSVEVAIAVEDLRALDRDREGRARRIARDEARRPFDLTRPPLVRFLLIRLADDEAIFVLTVHHVVFDGWSMGVLIAELDAFYLEATQGVPHGLPDLRVDYADFAVWERARAETGEARAGAAAWREALAGLPPPVGVPADAPRRAADAHEPGALCSRRLSASAALGVTQLCNQTRTTPFMLLVAAVEAVLHRWSGSNDITIGAPLANRTRPELEGLIGCFVNPVPLRLRPTPDLPFSELLSQAKAAALHALRHQDVSFQTIVDDAGAAHRPGRMPLFDVLLNFQNTPRTGLLLGGVRSELLDLSVPEFTGQGAPKFPLTLYAEWMGDELDLTAVFRSDLVTPERAALFLDQLVCLLGAVCDEPSTPLCRIPLAEPGKIQPDPQRPLPEVVYEPLVLRVARTIAQHADAVALEQGDRSWTFRELGAGAGVVRRALEEHGIAPADTVAVQGRSCPSLVAAVVGILFARATLLLVDPALPEARRRWMLGQVRVRASIHIGGEGIAVEGVPRIELAPDRIDGEPDPAWLPTAPLAREPAYVFFTSGSTGTPKPVLGAADGLSQFLDWQAREFRVGPRDRVAQLTSLSFDVVLRDLLLPVSVGATLCLPDPSRPTPEVVWLAERRITLVHAVPSRLRAWLRGPPETLHLPRLRLVLSAGEPLTDRLVDDWRARFPEAPSIVNLYGPTETTLAKCWYAIPDPPHAGVQPLGRPIPGTEVFVLSPDTRSCATGELGELTIRTRFASLGYLGEASEENRRFFANPFAPTNDESWYRTGDLGRIRPDGLIEIAGRIDDQIKVDGVRIAPLEIERALEEHEDVQQAAVTRHASEPEIAVLVAHVVLATGRALDPEALRSFLRARFPAALVPSRIVALDAMPLLANGKLDRRSLPPPRGEDVAAPSFTSPQTERERKIAQVWCAFLGRDAIGVTENFFDAGGSSLRAVEMQAQLSEAAGAGISPVTMLRYPTIRSLAAFLEGQAEVVDVWAEASIQQDRRRQRQRRNARPTDLPGATRE